MNRTNLIPFVFESNTIRAITDEHGEPWFIARDVFNALAMAWAGSQSLDKIKPAWKMGQPMVDPNGRMQETWIIREPAVYKLAFRSNKPEAERFTDWLAEEVLPSIRKTGQYQMMINRFLLTDPRDWERLFPFDYYYELCRVCGFSYEKHRPLPWIIGRLTWDLVYKRSLPVEVLDVLRDWKNTPEPGGRRRLPKPIAEGELEKPYRRSEKLHQLLTLQAADALVRRIDKVVIIARQSTDQRDLRARDNLDFGSVNTQLCLRFPYEGGERLQPPRHRTRTNVNQVPPAIVHADLFVG